MARDETGMNVVLIDTAKRLEELHRVYPGLAKRFECIGTSDSIKAKKAEKVKKPVEKQPEKQPVKAATPLKEGKTGGETGSEGNWRSEEDTAGRKTSCKSGSAAREKTAGEKAAS